MRRAGCSGRRTRLAGPLRQPDLAGPEHDAHPYSALGGIESRSVPRRPRAPRTEQYSKLRWRYDGALPVVNDRADRVPCGTSCPTGGRCTTSVDAVSGCRMQAIFIKCLILRQLRRAASSRDHSNANEFPAITSVFAVGS